MRPAARPARRRCARAPRRWRRRARPSRLRARRARLSSQRSLGEQLVAGAHRRVVAREWCAWLGLERQHQPVEEAPPLARAAGEQPVHRRRQPQRPTAIRDRRVHRCRGAVDPHLPPFGSAGEGPGADFASHRARAATAEAAAAALPRHLAERRAAQTASRREQRDRFEQVGLARAVLAEQQDEARPGSSEAEA